MIKTKTLEQPRNVLDALFLFYFNMFAIVWAL